MKTIVLFWVLLMTSFAEDEFLESAKTVYGFSDWPLSSSTNLVLDSWEPSVQWSLDVGMVVETNREPDCLELSVVQGNAILVTVRTELFETRESSRDSLLQYLAQCTSTIPFHQATNSWNQAGERCYVDVESATNSISLFYRRNAFVSVFSWNGRFNANSIAQEIDEQLRNCLQ